MNTEKIATSVYLEFHLRNKLKRISKILHKAESAIIEEAIQYYFANSEIVQEAQRKIIEDGKFLQREIIMFNSRGYEYRKGDDL